MKRKPARCRTTARGIRPAGAFASCLALLVAGCSATDEVAQPPVEVAAEPEKKPAAVIDEETRKGLLLLRARSVEHNLSKYARIVAPPGPFTFNDTLDLTFEIYNALGAPLELPAPEEGLRVELRWEVERWTPYGSRESQTAFRVARIPLAIRLEPGQAFQELVTVPLEASEDPSSLWVVSLAAKLHADGLILDGQSLPVNKITFQEARLMVFPPGWKPLQADPLGSLERILPLTNRSLDRHLLICAALLPPEQKDAGVEALVLALRDPADGERATTIITALTWLTGQTLGNSAMAWNEWWEQSKMRR